MQLVNPPWVNHDGGAVYSVDIHPTAEKLVTSGQADLGGDGLVIVWDLRPIKDAEAYADENIPKMLSKIKHYAGVNCVRWSPDGSLLACASDDKSVTIYEYAGRVKSSGTIGRKTETTVEKYRIAHNMHSHFMEVLAVAWSPDGRYLASASMDDTIIVWNAKKLPEKVVVLDSKRSGHTGPVKGISWDPIGKYLASQAGDKTVKFWATDNWQCETTITKPFRESGQTTMFSRLCWSADGQFCFAPCAMNNEGPVAQVIQRKDWDCSLDLVGHRKAVTVISACPRLFSYTDYTGNKTLVSCIAVGSRDKSLSVWVFPKVKRPVLVMTRLFKHSIMDISWKDFNLIVCSQDGTIKYISFTDKELGKLLDDSEMGIECEKIYKRCPTQFSVTAAENLNDSQLNGTLFIETADQLVAKKTAETDKEGETAEQEATTEAAEQAMKQAEALAEQRKEQIETRNKDGKRRIQPIFLASTVDDEQPVAAQPVAPKKVEIPKPIQVTSSVDVSVSPKKARLESTTSTDSDGSESSSSSDDEEMETSDGETGGATTADEAMKEQPTALVNDSARDMMKADFKKPTLRAVETTRITVSEQDTLLDMPERKANFAENVIGAVGHLIEVENEWKCTGVDLCRVTYQQAQEQSWTIYVEAPVASVAANRFITVLGCYDRTVRVFSSASGRLHCCLQLDSSPVRIGVNGHKMFALTQTGRFNSWDIDKRKAVVSRVAVSDCVGKDDHLQSISITVYGLPVLGFSNGDVFTYSTEMQCWQPTDTSYALTRLASSVDPKEIGDGHIGKLLNRRRRLGPMSGVPPAVRNSVSEGQLESWMNCAQSAGSGPDFKKFLVAYANQLLANGSQAKVMDLLSRLEGPGTICGLQKSTLRRDVEGLIKGNSSGLLEPKKSVF